MLATYVNSQFVFFFLISLFDEIQKPWSCLWDYLVLIDWLVDWLTERSIDWQVMKHDGENQAGLFWETSFEDILKIRQFVTQEKDL